VRVPHLADAADIIHWSDRREAEAELPRLVRRLIQENNDQVVELEIRSGEGTRIAGYDGTVRASHPTWFVPEGLSYWEMGSGADPQAKANSDYRKRTDELGDGVQSDATFVFVTSRRWSGKRQWQEQKQAEQRWRDVRAFDVDDVDQAMEAAPAVHVWFSEMVGKPARGTQSVEDWWNRFASRTNPALTPKMVLAGREDVSAESIRLFQQDRRVTIIGSKSVEDDLAFVAATVLSADEDLRSALLSRTLVVREAHALRWLDSAPNLVLLVPLEDTLRREADSIRHHVVYLGGEDDAADIALPLINQAVFAQYLLDEGVPEEEAERLARGAHRSLRRFQRLAAKSGSARVPEWAEQLRSRVIRRAWLAGGWNAGKSGDEDVLAAVFGQDYREVANELWEATRVADPLFTHVGGIWAVTSPEDSWIYCRGHLTSEDLLAIEAAIQSVLSAVDPALELPVEDRWKAAIYGKSRVHSSSLREGLATTLALLGAFGESVALGDGFTVRSWAERVIFTLLDRANKNASGHLWASLSDVLPLIAEAAPSVFLRAVQVGLEGHDPILKTQFVDQAIGFSVSSPHTGLLWALETLAWSGDHFGRTVDLLARLATIDPGGRLSNRPIGSLTDLFRPWLPQTSVDAHRRTRVLSTLVRRHPSVGWSLLLDLLPDHSGVAMPTHAPRFHTWEPTQKGVTYQEYWDFLASVVEEILALTRQDPSRWLDIASRVSSFPPTQRIQAYDQLEQLSREELPEDIRSHIWERLAMELRRHRTYADADWSLPEAEVDRLEEALEGFAPSNPLILHKWLFHDQFPNVGPSRRGGLDVYSAELARLREAAVEEILDTAGLPAILKLAAQVTQPWALGMTLAAIPRVEPAGVIDHLDANNLKVAELAFAYTRGASKGQLEWLQPLAHSLTDRPVAQARLLAICEDLQATWDYLGCLDPEADHEYWKEFRTVGRGAHFALVNESAQQLIAHGRPAAALDLLALYCDPANTQVDPNAVVDGFEALLSQDDPEVQQLSNWDIERLLEFLRDSDLVEDVLASLEWRLLPAIGIEGNSPILERRLARDPAFFVEILSLAFKPKAEDIEQQVLPHVALNAFRLLQDWRQIPGSDGPGGEVSEERLRSWITEVRRLLIESDRVSIGDNHLGKVFSHSRIDADGTWPTRPVRNAIEELGSADLEDGLHTGTVNKRRITSRGLGENGDQARKLAQDFDDQADAIMDEWPRTAAILRSLAEGYRVDARTHDDEADRFRQGMNR
jgi:hypothetical protein